MPTKISWCDEVWNPVTGCTPAGVGCQHCYAAAGVPFYFKQWGEFCGACQLPESEGNLDISKSALLNVLGEKGCPYPGDSDGEDHIRLFRVGTKRAGRTLDGRTHDALCWKVQK